MRQRAAGNIMGGRAGCPVGRSLKGTPPPLLLLAGRPGFRREPPLSLEARLAQPLGLFAPKTVLLDHFGVEQQRNGYELCRTSQSHPASETCSVGSFRSRSPSATP